MKPYLFGDKEYEFKRPTPVVLALAETLTTESELFNTILDLPKTYREDKEKFAKLSEDWKRFCDVVLKNGFVEELALDNVIYPDEVRGLAEDFFLAPFERTRKVLGEQAKSLQGISASQ
jgi:hypothetical protein